MVHLESSSVSPSLQGSSCASSAPVVSRPTSHSVTLTKEQERVVKRGYQQGDIMKIISFAGICYYYIIVYICWCTVCT